MDNEDKTIDGEEPAVPVCLRCLQTVSPLDHYCPHCESSVGQLTPYLPYEGIWFEAGMWGKLWQRLWYEKVDGLRRKFFYFVLILFMAPFLLIALPTVWWRKSNKKE